MIAGSTSIYIAEEAETPRLHELPVIDQVTLISEEYGVDSKLTRAIAHCESGFNASAKNPNSSAGGIFQFINSTWAENCKGDKYNSIDNITCAVSLISEGGLSHWQADPASELCWRANYGKI